MRDHDIAIYGRGGVPGDGEPRYEWRIVFRHKIMAEGTSPTLWHALASLRAHEWPSEHDVPSHCTEDGSP